MRGAWLPVIALVALSVLVVEGARARIPGTGSLPPSGSGAPTLDYRLDGSNVTSLAPATLGLDYTAAEPTLGAPAVGLTDGASSAWFSDIPAFGGLLQVTGAVYAGQVLQLQNTLGGNGIGSSNTLSINAVNGTDSAVTFFWNDDGYTPVSRLLMAQYGSGRVESFVTTGAPTWSFLGDGNTGIGQNGADILCQYTGGTCRSSLSSTTLTLTVPVLAPGGSAAAPGHSFPGASSNTGLYLIGADIPALSVDGTAVWYSNGLTNRFLQGLTPESTTLNVGQDSAQTWDHVFGLQNGPGDPTYSFGGDSNTGVYSSGANLLDFSTNGVRRGGFALLSFDSTVPVYVPVGSAVEPTYSFVGRTDDGVYSSAAGEVSIAAAGVQRVEINSAGMGLFGSLGTTGDIDGGGYVRGTSYLRSVGVVGIAPGSLPTCTGASSTQGGQIYHVDDGTDSDYCMCVRTAGTYGWLSATSRLTVCP